MENKHGDIEGRKLKRKVIYVYEKDNKSEDPYA